MKKKEKREKKDLKNLVIDSDIYKTSIPEGTGRVQVDTSIENPLELKAVIPGLINEILINVGQEVKSGEVLMILEAMKMRNRVYSKVDGIIEEILVKKGERVKKNQMLIKIK